MMITAADARIYSSTKARSCNAATGNIPLIMIMTSTLYVPQHLLKDSHHPCHCSPVWIEARAYENGGYVYMYNPSNHFCAVA